MTTLLHRVRQNIAWTIESITPQLTSDARGSLPAKFFLLGGVTPESSSGTTRGFKVSRPKRAASIEPTNEYSRWTPYEFIVDIYYSDAYKEDAIDEVTAQDEHNIQTALEKPDSWKGFNADNSTTDIGIKYRYLIDGELIDEEPFWISRLPFIVIVREVK